jgi:uncharacterized Ntn-hydrolase superfamily protein
VQANLMARATVWDAMAAAYEQTRGDLAERMLVAMEAAEAEGGDIRGRQSAALVVIDAAPTGKPWDARRFDLRVDDHAEPLVELRRILNVRRAYYAWDQVEAALVGEDVGEAQVAAALAAFRRCARLDAGEPGGRLLVLPVRWSTPARWNAALPHFQQVYAVQPVWRELAPRMAAAGLLPEDAGLLARITAV